MRWIWLDRIVEIEKGVRAVAIKNVSSAEDVVHDHFPADEQKGHGAMPCLPHTLVIEGFAQCAGILAGHALDFKEKVLLAKIGKCVFEPGKAACPGRTVRYTAHIDRLDVTGASTYGTVEILDPLTGNAEPFAQIEMMFAHADNNMQGIELPEKNFVFTDLFTELLERSNIEIPPDL